jgi:hypothetical protein
MMFAQNICISDVAPVPKTILIVLMVFKISRFSRCIRASMVAFYNNGTLYALTALAKATTPVGNIPVGVFF